MSIIPYILRCCPANISLRALAALWPAKIKACKKVSPITNLLPIYKYSSNILHYNRFTEFLTTKSEGMT